MGINKRTYRVTAAALAIALGLMSASEGEKHQAYQDPVGIWTICRGHIAGVKPGQVATAEQCAMLAEQDLSAAFVSVARLVKVELPDTRRAALADFVYNVGEGRFASSTLLRKLNAGDVVGACNELPKWVYAGGKKLPGLVKRRAIERELCLREG